MDKNPNFLGEYKFEMNRRFNNYTFSIHYSFGKKWKDKVNNTKPILQCG